ncbi:MAG: ASKHA domain-containing protein [Gammaproteobacteria bacterium]
MAKVVFTPSGKRGDFEVGTRVLDAARSLGVDIDSVCGGRALCGRCQVECMSGEFSKHGIRSHTDHLSSQSETEKHYGPRGRNRLADDRRLSCQALIEGDVVIDVPSTSQVHRQVVRKSADNRDITLDPAVRVHYVQVEEADMHEPKGDFQRLCEALESEWGLTGLECDLNVLQSIQSALRNGGWRVSVAVHSENRIIAVWPEFKSAVYGVAIDVGSTTVAAHLVNLSTGEILHSDGQMNPQIRFGEDLMSRVSYVMMHPEGAVEMTQAIRRGLNALLFELTDFLDAVTPKDILELTIVGNPIMHHLLLGIDPVELGGAPFALATDAAIELLASELDLEVNPGTRVYMLPCIAGHVGADSAAVVLSEAPQKADELTLLVDLGTNAEIVLGNRDRLLACSSPTGPAFEGAQISCGQRAAPGAIERVRIDVDTLEPRFQVIGSELWSDDDGFAEDVKASGVTGICGSGIIEVVAEMFLAGVITVDGVINGSLASQNKRIIADQRTWSYVLHDGDIRVTVTQNDVRQIQLAKAALHAGVSLLMDHYGSRDVKRIRLAGAFGSHIDVKHAMVLGLIPDCELENVSSAGNAAGMGALMALLNKGYRRTIEDVVKDIEKIETALEPKFQQYFVDAMAIPNKTDPYDKLFSQVSRPPERVAPPATDTTTSSRRRRRRRSV